MIRRQDIPSTRGEIVEQIPELETALEADQTTGFAFEQSYIDRRVESGLGVTLEDNTTDALTAYYSRLLDLHLDESGVGPAATKMLKRYGLEFSIAWHEEAIMSEVFEMPVVTLAGALEHVPVTVLAKTVNGPDAVPERHKGNVFGDAILFAEHAWASFIRALEHYEECEQEQMNLEERMVADYNYSQMEA